MIAFTSRGTGQPPVLRNACYVSETELRSMGFNLSRLRFYKWLIENHREGKEAGLTSLHELDPLAADYHWSD